MAIDYEVLGNRIRKKRLKQNIKQREMSRKMKVSEAYYSRIELGKTPLNLERVLEISNLLNISLSYLMSGIDEVSENYLDYEFKEILEKATSEQKSLIYEIMKLVLEI